MFGWVNLAIQRFVISQFEEQFLLEVLKLTNIDLSTASGNWNKCDDYPDYVTCDIIKAIQAILETDGVKKLEQFGAFFLQCVKTEGYESFLKSLGNNLPSWLANIGQFYESLHQSLPDSIPLKFRYLFKLILL